MSKTEDPSVPLATGWYLTKKSAVTLVALFTATCVGVGIVVYLATSSTLHCEQNGTKTHLEDLQHENPLKLDKVIIVHSLHYIST